MLCPFWDALTAGPLAPFATLWEDDLGVGGPSADGPEDPLLGTLLAMGVAEHPAPELAEEHDAYRAAAVQLAAAGAFLRRRGPAASVWDALNAWPMRVAPAAIIGPSGTAGGMPLFPSQPRQAATRRWEALVLSSAGS